jgi:uncharacterized membrane protein YphA (DoxX/SURF4 family)
MKSYQQACALLLRLAYGLTLLMPVADRLGWLGVPGEKNINWGNWDNFVGYTHTLNPYASDGLAQGLAVLVTLLEAGFGLLLIIGLFTRWAALGAGLLTGAFALSMAIVLGFKAPFNFSVWVDAAAGLLLATLPAYAYSLDHWLFRKRLSMQL